MKEGPYIRRRIPVRGRIEELYSAYEEVRDPSFARRRAILYAWAGVPIALGVGYIAWLLNPAFLWLYIPVSAFGVSVVAFLGQKAALERTITVAAVLEQEVPEHLSHVLGQPFDILCATLPGIDGRTMRIALRDVDTNEVYVAFVEDPIALDPIPAEELRVVRGLAKNGEQSREVVVTLVDNVCGSPERAARLQLESGWRWAGYRD